MARSDTSPLRKGKVIACAAARVYGLSSVDGPAPVHYPTVAGGQGVANILDAEPRIGISDATKAEGRRGQTTLFNIHGHALGRLRPRRRCVIQHFANGTPGGAT